MKKWLPLILIPILILRVGATPPPTQQERYYDWLWLHRSVGLHALEGCGLPDVGNRPFHTITDTMHVIAGGFDGRVRFYSGNLNGIPSATLEQIGHTGSCTIPETGGNYYGGNSFKIYFGGGSPLLSLFSTASKSAATQGVGSYPTAWDVMGQHLRPVDVTAPSVTQWEKYDIVVAKQAYIQWRDMTDALATQIEGWIDALADSVSHHPEVHFVFDWAGPLCFNGDPGADDFDGDTVQAKRVYMLVDRVKQKYIDGYSPFGVHKNFHVINYYQALCARDQGDTNRYCLDGQYWAGPGNQSHLSPLGYKLVQDSMQAAIRRIQRWVQLEKPGNPGIRMKTNTGENLGWPMNAAQNLWPDGVSATTDNADSILTHQDSIIAARYDYGTTNGDYRRINAVKAIKPSFRHFEYNSFQDNYVTGPSVEEHNWLSSWATSHGISPEKMYLHYWDATTISLQGYTLNFVGLSNATSLADSVNSRVPAYYADRSRIIPNYSDATVRQAEIEYAKYQLSRKQSGMNDEPDGIFWDNTQPAFWNWGTLISGGSVAEVSGHPLISTFGYNSANIWYLQFIKPFHQALRAEISLTNNPATSWAPGGERRYEYQNTSGTIYNLMATDQAGLGFGNEFFYDPANRYGTDFTTVINWDILCRANGIVNIYSPEPCQSVSGSTDTFTYIDALHNLLCSFLCYSTDSSVLSAALNVGWSTFWSDSLFWIGSWSYYLGEMSQAQPTTVAATGTDPGGYSYTIYSRTFPFGKVFYRPRPGSSHTINHDREVTLSLGGYYREVAPDGSMSQPVTSVTFRNAEGRILIPVGASASVTLSSVRVDSASIGAQGNDYNLSTEADHIYLRAVCGSDALSGAVVEFAWSTTSSTPTFSTPPTVAYAANTTVTYDLLSSYTEDFTLYMAARVRKSDGTYGTTLYAQRNFNNITPQLSSMSMDSVLYVPGETNDVYRINYTMPNNGTLDSVGFGFSEVGFSSITAPSQWYTFVPNLSTSFNYSTSAVYPYTMYVKGWIMENGELSTARQVSYTMNVQATPPAVPGVRVKNAVHFKGQVRFK